MKIKSDSESYTKLWQTRFESFISRSQLFSGWSMWGISHVTQSVWLSKEYLCKV